MDLWLPPKPAIIIPADKPKPLHPAITFLASTAFQRARIAAAAAAIEFVSIATGSAANGGNVTITMPGAVAAGDLVIGFVTGWWQTASPTAAQIDPTTTGYTQAAFQNGINEIAGGQWAGWKFMTGTPDADLVFPGSGNGGDSIACILAAFRGVNATTPMDATATVAKSNSTNPDPPSITVATANSAVVIFGGSLIEDASPSGTITNYLPTTPTSVQVAEDNPTTCAAAYRLGLSAGAENPGAFNTWTSSPWGAMTLALRPA
jgi:hypothetical protein